jgi:hypothetical protein
MPVKKPVESDRSDPKNWGTEQRYNNRTLIDNWFEERRMYHQLCSRCTGHSVYRTEYLPYCKEDYAQDTCIPPKKYQSLAAADGEGWKLLRNTEDYCDYLSNYTTTYDLVHNWDIRRAGCKPKPKRRWKPVMDSLWVPEQDFAVSFGNLTQYGFRKAPTLPPVPNDWKTYDMSTEYTNRFAPHRYPESYTLCRYSPPKHVIREMEEYILADKPGKCSCASCRLDPKANNACCRGLYLQNPKRFSNKCVVSNLKPHPACQTLLASKNEQFPQLKRPPHPYPFYSAPDFNGPHSCQTPVACAVGKMAQDTARVQLAQEMADCKKAQDKAQCSL